MTLHDIEQKLSDLERQKLVEQSEDKKTWSFKFRNKRMERLGKQARKKAEYVLVQYLTIKGDVKFQLAKIVSGDIIVIDNKAHLLNPRDLWISGKYRWFIIKEIDYLPVTNRDYNKLAKLKRLTSNHVVLIKALLAAVQKKEGSEISKGWIKWIVIIGIAAFLIYIFFFSK